MVAELAQLGFESFAEEGELLFAYIQEGECSEDEIKELSIFQLPNVKIEYSSKYLPKENWNKKWEESFEPIYIEDFCSIRAPFHKRDRNTKYDLIIEPKMSFGTGHHATTQLMIKQMQTLSVSGTQVLDMGAGTGVLGILAKQMGAKKVIAIDIEEWAFENMQENASRNQVEIACYLGGKEVLERLEKQFDIIIANINKNILFDQLPIYLNKLSSKGVVLLSGFFDVDVDEFEEWSKENNLQLTKMNSLDSWASIRLEKG